MRKISFAEGCFYHIYNRGVDKRNIFLEDCDRERFLYLMFACNDVQPLLNSQFHYRGLASIVGECRNKDKLVDIISFCLMPNHFHMILRQKKEKGVPVFMQKLGTGYTMYFNIKNKRSGSLFQGTFKAIHIDKQNYLNRVTAYVHFNPAELREPKWKDKGIKNWYRTYDFVENYSWSSYRDFLGIGRFKSVLSMSVMHELFGSLDGRNRIEKDFINKDVGHLDDYMIDTIEA